MLAGSFLGRGGSLGANSTPFFSLQNVTWRVGFLFSIAKFRYAFRFSSYPSMLLSPAHRTSFPRVAFRSIYLADHILQVIIFAALVLKMVLVVVASTKTGRSRWSMIGLYSAPMAALITAGAVAGGGAALRESLIPLEPVLTADASRPFADLRTLRPYSPLHRDTCRQVPSRCVFPHLGHLSRTVLTSLRLVPLTAVQYVSLSSFVVASHLH